MKKVILATLLLLFALPASGGQETYYGDERWRQAWMKIVDLIEKQDDVMLEIKKSALHDPPGRGRSLDREELERRLTTILEEQVKVSRRLLELDVHPRQ